MLAERLAQYAGSLSYGRLPPQVIHEVKRRVLDSLGCALAAWNAPPCRIARQLAREVTVPNGATVWGTGARTQPDLAAFANGALVRYLDFNDTYLSREPAHPSDNLAAIFALGETVHASGKQVITALALAYEIHCRLCDAAALRPRGWDHVTYGPFSSALAGGNLLKLSKQKMTQAINLAGVANIALRQTRVGDLSMWKACAFSNATRNGVFAVLLAKMGMTGPSPIFEGEKGFMNLVSGSLELPILAAERGNNQGARQLETTFKISDSYIKHFPVEYHAQTAVEAALLVREEIVKAEGEQGLAGIREVEIGSYDVAIEIIGRDREKWHPRTRETADHSFPYCVGVALLDGRVTLRSFAGRRLRDRHLLQLIQKIRVVEEPAFKDRYPKAMPTRLIVKTAAAQPYRRQVDVPLGHPRNPMSDHEVENKFLGLVQRRLNRTRIEKLMDLVWNLERVKDIGTLMPLLRITDKSTV